MEPNSQWISDAVKRSKEKRKTKLYPTLPQGFSLRYEGRSGAVFYRKEDKILDIYWEMSGVDDYDILLLPLDLSEWSHPEGERIPDDEREQIVCDLEIFLKGQNIKSDAFAPLKRPLY